MSREEIDSIVNRNLSAPKQCPSSFQPDSLLKAVQENDSFVVKCIVRGIDSSFSSVYEYIKKILICIYSIVFSPCSPLTTLLCSLLRCIKRLISI